MLSRTCASIAGQQLVDAIDYMGLRGARDKAERHRIEGAVEIEDGFHALARHPKNTEAAIVGHQITGAERIDELGRQDDSDDPERTFAPIEDGLERRTG